MASTVHPESALRVRVRWVLLGGVLLSAACILTGWCVVGFMHARGETDRPIGLADDEGDPDFRFHGDPVGAWKDLWAFTRPGPGSPAPSFLEFLEMWWSVQGKGLPWINLGVGLLILTPMLRAAGSFSHFVRGKDWRFAGLTGATLLLLVCSIVIQLLH